MPGRGLQASGLVRRLRLHVRRWAAHRMVLAIILGIAAASFGLPLVLPPLRLADETFSDLLIGHFSPPEPQHRGIAMVAIGEDSFVALACRSPVDRAFLADLIERLRAAKVRAIGIDILFDQPTIPAERRAAAPPPERSRRAGGRHLRLGTDGADRAPA